jgi:hypothetical protein
MRLVVFSAAVLPLASCDRLMTKFVKALPRLQDRKRAADIAREIERQVSAYLYVTTLVNLGFGAVVAATMLLLRMPNAVLWGVLAAITSFIPYLGGVLCTVLLGMARDILAYPDWQRARGRAAGVRGPRHREGLRGGAAAAPDAPDPQHAGALHRRSCSGGGCWGIPGALLAVPILSVVKIVCERVEGWRPLAEFLGDAPARAASPPQPPAARGA